jgi:hypothetical protein
MIKRNSISPNEICPHCHGPIHIRNPSGICDHLYYPEYCKICEKLEANGGRKTMEQEQVPKLITNYDELAEELHKFYRAAVQTMGTEYGSDHDHGWANCRRKDYFRKRAFMLTNAMAGGK